MFKIKRDIILNEGEVEDLRFIVKAGEYEELNDISVTIEEIDMGEVYATNDVKCYIAFNEEDGYILLILDDNGFFIDGYYDFTHTT